MESVCEIADLVNMYSMNGMGIKKQTIQYSYI